MSKKSKIFGTISIALLGVIAFSSYQIYQTIKDFKIDLSGVPDDAEDCYDE